MQKTTILSIGDLLFILINLKVSRHLRELYAGSGNLLDCWFPPAWNIWELWEKVQNSFWATFYSNINIFPQHKPRNCSVLFLVRTGISENSHKSNERDGMDQRRLEVPMHSVSIQYKICMIFCFLLLWFVSAMSSANAEKNSHFQRSILTFQTNAHKYRLFL